MAPISTEWRKARSERWGDSDCSGSQIHAGRGIAWNAKQPGDLVFFSYPGADGPHHVAIYVGGDRILQAPRTGDVVRYGTIGEFAGEVMTVRRLG
ncbi:C40 family peptidase [Flexivirga lutea]